MSQKDSAFLGTGWSFPPSFDKESASVEMVSGEDDILQSLQILLSTFLGERIMRPGYGVNIRQYLFESIDTSILTQIKDELAGAILLYETRIKINSIDATFPSKTDGIVYINLDYSIKATNSRNNMVHPFYLLEGTLIQNKIQGL